MGKHTTVSMTPPLTPAPANAPEGGLRRFRDFHQRTLAEGAALADLKVNIRARESGGTTLELVDRIEAEPASMRPLGPRAMWSAIKQAFGAGQESAAAAEFPNLLSTNMLKRAYRQAANWQPQGMRFCDTDSTSKIEELSPRPMLSAAQTLVKVPSGTPAPLGQFSDTKISVQADPYKRGWELEPKVFINDDLGAFNGLMAQVTESWQATLDEAIASTMHTPGNSDEDSTAFFHTNHGNKGTVGLTWNDTGANVTCRDAYLAMRAQKRFGSTTRYAGVKPTMLVVPVALETIGRALCTVAQVPLDAGTAMTANQFAAMGINPQVFDCLGTDTNDWFLLADPNVCPAFRVTFLNGRTVPSISAGYNTGGIVITDGSYLDADGFPKFPVHIEVQFYFGVKAFDYRGAYAGNVPGGT